MRVPVCLLALLALLAVAGGAAAQPEAMPQEGEAWTPRFERALDVEPHLPQSSVYEILEDQRGFLWFATREGLGRWDGYTMRTWRVAPFDAASLPGNVIHRMMMDGAGSIWVETQNNDNLPVGIARLAAPDHEDVRRYGFPDGRLFLGPDSIAWLADRDSLYRHDAAADRFVAARARLTAHRPAIALTRRDGSVWLPTSGAVVEVYDLPTGVVRLVRADWPTGQTYAGASSAPGHLFEDRHGELWLTGPTLSRLTPEGDHFETVYAPDEKLPTDGYEWGASEVIEDDTGRLWVATLDGVYRFRPERPGAPERFSLLLPGDIATQNFVTALFRDRAGTFWAGTVWGLHRADPYANPFRLIEHDPSDPTSLGSGLVLSLQEDAEGALWVGTLGGGLNRLDLATGQARRYPWGTPGGTSGSWIWNLGLHPDGTLYVSTGNGLDRIDTRRPARVEPVPFTRLSDLPESEYTAHVDARDGSVWVGQAGGLVRVQGEGGEVLLATGDSVSVQHVLTEEAEVWVATLEGLYRLERRTGAVQVYRHALADPTSLSHDATLYLHRDRRGRLWVGTNSGLNRYVPATDGFAHVSAADGLPSDVVYAIHEDDAGHLWCSTNRGLARLRETAAGLEIDVFGEADGVGNIEFNRRAATRGHDGTLYFGGDRGVTAFHPAEVRRNPHAPRVVLTALHRATQDGTTTERYLGAERYHGGAPIRIPPDASTFSFEYAALSFTSPHRNRYAVQMAGWDAAWVPMGEQRRATYTNLPPGRYTFRVKAANEDGVWNEAGVAVPVVVAPWFWQTGWFRALVGLAAVGLVAFVAWSFSHRAYQRRLAQLEAQRALERERARISRDMHDEVGASLTEIAILSELAQLQAARPGGDGAPADGPPAVLPGAAVGHLQQIAETSRATLDAIGQIVWALNPRNDRLDHLVAYLRESAAQALEPTALDVVLRFPDAVPPRPVTTEFRRNVFLVMREALHNLVKHAEAHRATVTLRLASSTLELVVEDDGRGFAEARRFGNGLRNMRERAEEIGGTLVVESEPGAGTRLILHAPLPEVEVGV